MKKGKAGAEEIKQMMTNYRNNPPKEIGGSPVVSFKDYNSLIEKDKDGKEIKLDMPVTSNVLQFFTADGSKISIRPSGTEPKIKFYVEVLGEMKSAKDFEAASAAANKKIDAVKVSFGL